jgi:hypothetical protein
MGLYLNRFLNLHIQTLEMEATRSCETVVSTYKTIRCHNPEDHNLIESLVVSKFWTGLLFFFFVFWCKILYSIHRGNEDASLSVSDVNSYISLESY